MRDVSFLAGLGTRVKLGDFGKPHGMLSGSTPSFSHIDKLHPSTEKSKPRKVRPEKVEQHEAEGFFIDQAAKNAFFQGFIMHIPP